MSFFSSFYTHIFKRRSLRHGHKTPITDTHGGTAIEFALLMPVFFVFIIGMFDVGTMMIIRTSLEEGAREASRYGITGGKSSTQSRGESINTTVINSIQTISGGIVDTSKIVITVKSYSALTGVGQPEPFIDTNGDGKYEGPGQPGGPEPFTDTNGNGIWDADQGVTGSFGVGGQAVQYIINYTWKPFVLGFIPSLGSITLTGTATVSNESF